MTGEFEPKDSRNVTGTASTPDGRWTGQSAEPPLAAGQSPQQPETGQQPEDQPRNQQGGGGMSDGGMDSDEVSDDELEDEDYEDEDEDESDSQSGTGGQAGSSGAALGQSAESGWPGQDPRTGEVTPESQAGQQDQGSFGRNGS